MDSIDSISAIKASLEMMAQENQELMGHFQELIEKLGEIEQMDSEQKKTEFKNLESSGAFKFNGLDIRHFAKSNKKPLSPPMFMKRTQRRLQNTITLLDELMKRGDVEQGEELRAQIQSHVGELVDVSDQNAVLAFKSKVEELSESPLFTNYQDTKTSFIQNDEGLKVEAEIIAAKETVEEGEELARSRQEDIERIGEMMEKGELTSEEAEAELEKLGSASD